MSDANRSWLYLILLTVLTALSSSICQWWSIRPTFPIVGINVAAALCLFTLAKRNICALLILMQCLFAIVCISVSDALTAPLNLSTIIHGVFYTGPLGLSVFSYIPGAKALFFVGCALVQFLLLFKITKLPYRKRVGLLALAIFVIALGSTFAVQPLRAFWPNLYREAGDDGFTLPERHSLHVRGYLATYALELATGYPWRIQSQPQPMESPDGTENLPLLPCADKVAFIQVESLDYEMLTAKAQGEYVMPFLHSLLDHAVVLRLDGTKKMGSANSDYEIFTGRIASHSILHYQYEKDYSASLLHLLVKSISPSYTFHGMPSNNMNTDVAYHCQGVQHVYAFEKMRDEGVPVTPVWNGVIGDADILDFAATKIPDSGPFFHFTITLDMHFPHDPEKICDASYLLKMKEESRGAYYALCRHTDAAIAAYVRRLPAGTAVAIWGDHKSYTSEASGYIPFLFFITGQSHPFAHEDTPPLNRSKIYYYLKKNFSQLVAQQVPATAESGR